MWHFILKMSEIAFSYWALITSQMDYCSYFLNTVFNILDSHTLNLQRFTTVCRKFKFFIQCLRFSIMLLSSVHLILPPIVFWPDHKLLLDTFSFIPHCPLTSCCFSPGCFSSHCSPLLWTFTDRFHCVYSFMAYTPYLILFTPLGGG